MKQAAFEQLHGRTWNRLEELLEELEQHKSTDSQELKHFSSLFRKVCHFHALAIERQYSSYLVDQIEDIVVRAQQQLYRRKHGNLVHFIRFIVQDLPALVRSERYYVAIASALFILPTLILWIGTLVSPELVYTVVDPAQVSQMEAMYDPANRIVGSARDSGTNWSMFGFYIQNNISVSFRTFASGIAYGIGSGFFLIFNGALLGAVAGHLTNVGFSSTFFTFVIGHGSFELTAIVLSGAAGLRLGYALLAPGQLTRIAALKYAAHIAIRIVYGVILMLVIAAFIEAFWSSNNLFPAWLKYTVGAGLWALVLSYFYFCGRNHPEIHSR